LLKKRKFVAGKINGSYPEGWRTPQTDHRRGSQGPSWWSFTPQVILASPPRDWLFKFFLLFLFLSFFVFCFSEKVKSKKTKRVSF
jgi:hypothetical protein